MGQPGRPPKVKKAFRGIHYTAVDAEQNHENSGRQRKFLHSNVLLINIFNFMLSCEFINFKNFKFFT